ncbi:hypothetical protein FRC00_000821 [Tulasnella sp. 408]|nr:hypothetical protein FRC00_000821 [Tulasnella sp. 408]
MSGRPPPGPPQPRGPYDQQPRNPFTQQPYGSSQGHGQPGGYYENESDVGDYAGSGYHGYGTDAESTENDVYGNSYPPSSESLPQGSRGGHSDYSTAQYGDYGPSGSREPYPAWTAERQIPLSKE